MATNVINLNCENAKTDALVIVLNSLLLSPEDNSTEHIEHLITLEELLCAIRVLCRRHASRAAELGFKVDETSYALVEKQLAPAQASAGILGL